MDTPSQAAKLASQALNLVTAGADLVGLYAFKFSVTLSTNNGVAKNGLHWGDNVAAPYNIGDSTLGGEGFRLIAERLAGAKDILDLASVNAASLVDAKAVAVRDADGYYVFVANTGTVSLSVPLNLAGWSVADGTPVTVERMGDSSYGEVTDMLTAANGAVAVVSAEREQRCSCMLLCSSTCRADD